MPRSSPFIESCLTLAAGVLVAWSSVAAQQPEARRIDRFGDPLPPGAFARLGTTRLRTTASALALAADGKTLVTVAGGRTLGRWDPDTGRLLGDSRLPGAASDRRSLSADRSCL